MLDSANVLFLFLFLQSLFSKVREQFVSLYYVSFLVLHYFAVIWFLPARASEQGNVIGLVSVYICT